MAIFTTVLVLLAGGSVALSAQASTRVTPAAAIPDALTARAVSTLNGWTSWLQQNKVHGYVGEVGWPRDDPRWSTVANAWYDAAESASLPVTNWVTGEWAGSLQLANYVRAAPDWTFQSSASSDVMEARPGTAAAPHGDNVTGPEMGTPAIDATSSFSNASVGILDQTYHYDSASTFTYLAGRGVQIVRIPFRWERIQRSLFSPLDVDELGRLTAMVHAASAAGLRVVLDLHNFGGYYLSNGTVGVRRAVGSTELPVSAFKDVWARLAWAFVGDPSVWAFDLMNEPVGMPASPTRSAAKLWEQASQAAVDVIRRTGDKRLLMVGGYNWSGMASWQLNHPTAWIKDSARNTAYEAHQYFNSDNSGVYLSYDQELALATPSVLAARRRLRAHGLGASLVR
ncbi:MAG: cellulase family glycosylhydrolase [Actinomycetota bacterium]